MHRISIGDLELTIVSGGRLSIDGGNMFGVIPRVMWERKSVPDDSHHILLETNCLLVRTPDSLGLIDSGYGGKAAEKVRKRSAMEDGAPLVRNLKAAGVAPADIDWVILTHLHFDHAGGCTFFDESGQLRPTFPRARHIVQQAEWDDATGNLPELVGAYFLDDFQPLDDAGLIERVEGPSEVVPGISTKLTGGHTRGHQMVFIESKDDSVAYPCDICPTAAHLPTLWTMAYDQFPLDVRRVKPGILQDIANANRILVFAHDPHTPAGRLVNDDQGNLTVEPL
jgi:glyoxylase-like metal-dependent hydrolase (beta-lactamase superfamily II)